MENTVTLIGHTGKDAELSKAGETSVAKFSLATSRSYKDKAGEWQQTTQWHNIVVWRELADRIGGKLKKGMLVLVKGELTYRKYTDKDGIERQVAEIVADTCRALEKAQRQDTAPAPTETPAHQPARQEPAPQRPQPEDLPF